MLICTPLTFYASEQEMYNSSKIRLILTLLFFFKFFQQSCVSVRARQLFPGPATLTGSFKNSYSP